MFETKSSLHSLYKSDTTPLFYLHNCLQSLMNSHGYVLQSVKFEPDSGSLSLDMCASSSVFIISSSSVPSCLQDEMILLHNSN